VKAPVARRSNFSGCLRLWQMHDDFEGLAFRHLSRPTDDKFLHVLVEVFFTEWKGIEGVKELGDILDSQLDCLRGWPWLLTHLCLALCQT
jgi:hypothetical protein